MIIKGTHTVAAPAVRVFARLRDPAILQQCISGCEKMEKIGEDDYAALLKLGIGSIKGSYTGRVKLTDPLPPNKFTLGLNGQGGPGFVKGTAIIELSAEGEATHISYTADVQVGGLIAAVGSRMIEAAAKKLAGEFFRAFAAVV